MRLNSAPMESVHLAVMFLLYVDLGNHNSGFHGILQLIFTCLFQTMEWAFFFSKKLNSEAVKNLEKWQQTKKEASYCDF